MWCPAARPATASPSTACWECQSYQRRQQRCGAAYRSVARCPCMPSSAVRLTRMRVSGSSWGAWGGVSAVPYRVSSARAPGIAAPWQRRRRRRTITPCRRPALQQWAQGCRWSSLWPAAAALAHPASPGRLARRGILQGRLHQAPCTTLRRFTRSAAHAREQSMPPQPGGQSHAAQDVGALLLLLCSMPPC